MSLKYILSAAAGVALLPTVVFGQGFDCDEGFVFDPDAFECVPDSGEPPVVDEGLIPKLLRFLTPDEGAEFLAGTEVAPTGRTSLTNVQELPLDLTIVIDDSASMRAPTNLRNEDTPNPNDRLSTLDVVKQGVGALLNSLAEDAVVTVVSFGDMVKSTTEKVFDANFDDVTDPGSGQTRAQVARFVDDLDATGRATRYDLALNEVLSLYSGGVSGGSSLDTYDRELLFLSDGRPSSANYFAQLNALQFRGVDPLFVSLPGNSGQGNAVLAQAAMRTGGRLFDYSSSAQGLLDAFDDPASSFFGISTLEITNPDNTSYFADTDAFGNFILTPFALAEGNNTFTATARFENGARFTDTLTLVGTGADVPAVPLPASMWFLGLGLVGLGVIRKRARFA